MRSWKRSVAYFMWAMICVLAWTSVVPAQRDRGERRRDRDRRERQPQSRRGAADQEAHPRLLPPVLPGDKRWMLGVQIAYQDTGAQVTHVIPRSPAMQAGLEPRDVIVTVAGYQVGYVNGRLYPVEREMDLRADRYGHVRLLVRNHRNGDLTNIDVQLQPAQRRPRPERPEALLGTVTTRSGTQPPRNARLTIQLVDISNRLGSLEPVAQRQYTDLGPFPIPFELAYDPERIDPRRRYALRATLSVSGMPALQTRETYRVFTNGRAERVDMILERTR